MDDDQTALRTIDDYLALALTADAAAPAATLAHVHAALTAPRATDTLRRAGHTALASMLGALPAASHTLARLCVLAAAPLAPALWAPAAEATLAAPVPAHLLAALPATCAVVHRLAAAVTAASPRCGRAPALAAAALADGVLAALAAAGLADDVVTPVHTDALALRLAAGDVRGALPLARRAPAASFAPAPAPTQQAQKAQQQHAAAALLAFDYYAGVVLAAADDLPRALARFERVCRAPALTPPSWIALAAYRKYVLAALAVRGALPADAPVPRLPARDYGRRARPDGHDVRGPRGSCGGCGGGDRGVRAVAAAETHVAVYQELAGLVGALRVREVRAFVQQHAAVLRADGNLGLARRVEARLLQHVVRRMGTVFAACSIADMLRAAQLPASDAPALADAVRALAHDNTVSVAFADAAGTVVRFGRSNSDGDSKDSCAALADGIRTTLATARALDAARAEAERARPAALAAAAEAEAALAAAGVGDGDVYYRDDDDDDDDDVAMV